MMSPEFRLHLIRSAAQSEPEFLRFIRSAMAHFALKPLEQMLAVFARAAALKPEPST
jgi:hypothetical protein